MQALPRLDTRAISPEHWFPVKLTLASNSVGFPMVGVHSEMALMDWEIVYYTDDVQELISAFPPGLQARYIHLTERMLTFGPDLAMPHTRAMGNGLFELRLKSKEGIGRVFFCNQPDRRIRMKEVRGDDDA